MTAPGSTSLSLRAGQPSASLGLHLHDLELFCPVGLISKEGVSRGTYLSADQLKFPHLASSSSAFFILGNVDDGYFVPLLVEVEMERSVEGMAPRNYGKLNHSNLAKIQVSSSEWPQSPLQHMPFSGFGYLGPPDSDLHDNRDFH